MSNDTAKAFHSIEGRLSAIERQSRGWKCCTVILASMLGVVLLSGAQAPLPSVLKAKAFVLVDDKGISRAELRVHAGDSQLVLFNADGKGIPLALSASPGIVLSKSKSALTMTLDDDGPHLMLADSAGFMASIGHIPQIKRLDGSQTNPSVVSIALSDVRGRLSWSAP